MEQIQINSRYKCINHPNHEIIYLQVNEIGQNQIVFYCESCISQDYDFKPSNCIRIKQLLESQQDQLIYSWPPLNDKKLQKKVNDFDSKESEKYIQLQMKVIADFDELRAYIQQKLNNLQKEALKQIEKVYQFENQFVEKYQEISQVNMLKKIVQDYFDQKDEMQSCLKEFINYYQKQKDDNSRMIKQFFDQQELEITRLNNSDFNEIKETITDLLDNIQYFKQDSQHLSFKKNILPEIQFIKSNYAQGFNDINVYKNSVLNTIMFQQVFQFNQNTSEQYYSNFILDPTKKYVFQFRSTGNQILDQQGIFIIGLLRDEVKDQQQFINENMCCGILFSNRQMYLDSLTNGINKIVKGDFDYLDNSTELELTIHQSEDILEITDIPQKNHKAVLMDYYKFNLQTFKNLRLCIKLYDNVSILLTSATVE